MVGFYEEIPSFLMTWIPQQKMFWVASAPLSGDGLINLSPKGLEGSFHVVNSKRVWYEDITGSGVETIAHLRENGRITVLFSAFEGAPRSVRIFGTGTVYEFGTPEYEALLPPEKRQIGSRSVIMIDVIKASTSCGYGIPIYQYKSERTRLLEFCIKKEAVDIEVEGGLDLDKHKSPPRPETGLKGYWVSANGTSINGLPGILSGHESLKPFPVKQIKYDKKDEEKNEAKTEEGASGQWGALSVLLDPKIVAAFGMGVLVSTTYARFMKDLLALAL